MTIPFKTVPSPLRLSNTKLSFTYCFMAGILTDFIFFFMSLTQGLWFEKNEYSFVKMPSPLDFTCQNLSLWLLMLLLLRKPSQVVAVFSTTRLTALGLEVGQVHSPLLPGHQTMASGTQVLLIAVTCCAVPSIPCSFKNGLIAPYSLSTVLVVSIQMVLSVSWPLSSAAELKGCSMIFYSASATTLVITLSLPLPITQTLLWPHTPHSPTLTLLSSSRTPSPMILWPPWGTFVHRDHHLFTAFKYSLLLKQLKLHAYSQPCNFLVLSLHHTHMA